MKQIFPFGTVFAMHRASPLKGNIMKAKIAAVLFALSSFNAAHANIITNGNFEQGNTGWNGMGNVDLAARHSLYGSDFYFGGGSKAQNGNYAIAFNAGNTLGTGQLWQSFATTAGTTYTLSFDYGTNLALPQTLNWSVFGLIPLLAFDGGFATDVNPSSLLDTYAFNFVANSASTTLLFTDSILNYTLGIDGLLDNISVTAKTIVVPTPTPNPAAVPEPGSLALLGLGVLGFGLARRRKSA